jgi:hypothetical protein
VYGQQGRAYSGEGVSLAEGGGVKCGHACFGCHIVDNHMCTGSGDRHAQEKVFLAKVGCCGASCSITAMCHARA